MRQPMNTPTRPPIVVLHSEPDDLRALLAAALPDERVVFATHPDAVLATLRDAQPDIVFSIKHSGFPGAAHRPAIDAPTVRWVHVGGSGYEHLTPWDAARVTLTNCHGVLARVLAETVVGAILSLNRGLHRYRDHQRARVWRPHLFRDLRGQTLLLVGVGAIGGHVAPLARALGLRVLGVRRNAAPHPDVDEMHTPDALPGLLARADIVSVHLRATPDTAGFFDAARFAAMKPGAMFVNTSRGSVVDEGALRDALARGAVGSAYLDVFAQEPIAHESPWWGMDNVLVTPHASDNVDDGIARFAEVFVDNVRRWRAGESLTHVVAPA